MDHNQPPRSTQQHPCHSPLSPRGQADPIPVITLTTAAPGAALELDGLMTCANGR